MPRRQVEVASAALVRETNHVPEFCTCGTQLPPDARFCHKCGKPQFDLPDAVVEPPIMVPAAVLPGPRQTAEINFRNRTAVRVGLLAAAIASVCISLPIPMRLNVVWMLGWLVGAGFLAVYLYGRRTGEVLSVQKGVRMGWITGVFCFVIATIFFTITIMAISNDGGLGDFYREQLTSQAGDEVNVQELLEVLESPSGLAAIILFSLLMLFLLFTLLPTLGGAMGAKVLQKE